jgi:hypothetical protein
MKHPHRGFTLIEGAISMVRFDAGNGNYTTAMTGAVPTPDAIAASWSCMSN